jgi:hypothetical protein
MQTHQQDLAAVAAVMGNLVTALVMAVTALAVS